jgi:hypothetical protein
MLFYISIRLIHLRIIVIHLMVCSGKGYVVKIMDGVLTTSQLTTSTASSVSISNKSRVFVYKHTFVYNNFALVARNYRVGCFADTPAVPHGLNHADGIFHIVIRGVIHSVCYFGFSVSCRWAVLLFIYKNAYLFTSNVCVSVRHFL